MNGRGGGMVDATLHSEESTIPDEVSKSFHAGSSPAPCQPYRKEGSNVIILHRVYAGTGR